MKDQYIGDINDYRKYTLLRALARDSGLHIGVCWMMTPNDDRTDGNKRLYLRQPNRWRHHDPDLFDELAALLSIDSSPPISRVEVLPSLKGMTYVNATVSDGLAEREAYMAAAKATLIGSELIFFDPDNGLNVASIKKGNRNSSKYIYRDELADFYRTGKSLLVYQHYPRIHRGTFE
jgi:hypothetical protein